MDERIDPVLSCPTPILSGSGHMSALGHATQIEEWSE